MRTVAPNASQSGMVKIVPYTEEQITMLMEQPNNKPVINAELWRRFTKLSAVELLSTLINKEATE